MVIPVWELFSASCQIGDGFELQAVWKRWKIKDLASYGEWLYVWGKHIFNFNTH